MPRLGSARRYSQAVFELALERAHLDEWMGDLTYVTRTLENEQLGEFLDSPQVSEERKTGLIEATLKDCDTPLSRNLVSLLASRNMTHLIPGITDQYQRLLDAYRGIEQGEVVSAVPLDDEQLAKVNELLKRIVGREVRLESRVDPSIIGGLVARVGDHVVDGSTNGKLQKLRRELVGEW